MVASVTTGSTTWHSRHCFAGGATICSKTNVEPQQGDKQALQDGENSYDSGCYWLRVTF